MNYTPTGTPQPNPLGETAPMQKAEQTEGFQDNYSQAGTHSLEVENEDLRAEIDHLRSELDDCHSQLLKFISQGNQISEASLKNDYTQIYGSIEVWVDYVLHDEPADFKQFYKDILHYKTKWPLKDLRIDDNDLDQPWLRKHVRNSESSAYFVLSSIVSNFLYRHIFRRRHPVGLLQQQSDVIEEVVDSMQRLKQDQSVVDEWRSQALSALIVSEQFKDAQKHDSDSDFIFLKECLADWLPYTSRRHLVEKCASMLWTNIYSPALELHKKICCSTTRYEVTLNPFQGKWDTTSCTCVDVSTWRSMNGSDVDPVYTLYPALRRIGGEKTLDLVGPTLLAARPSSKTTSRSSTMDTSPERKTPSYISSSEGGRSKSVVQEAAKPQSGLQRLSSMFNYPKSK